MKKIISVFVVILILMSLFFCKQGDIAPASGIKKEKALSDRSRIRRTKTFFRKEKFSREQSKDKQTYGGASNVNTPSGQTGKTALQKQTRKISRTANLSISVENFDKAYKKILSMTEGVAYAYIASSNTYVKSNNDKYGNIKIRVPSDNFRDIYVNLKSIGKVKTEKVKTKDFTKQYFDLEAQLRTEQGYKARLEAIMKTRAKTYDEVQDAYERIRKVQKKIDRIKGFMRYINSMTDYSTIYISLYEGDAPVATRSFGKVISRIWTGIKTGIYNMILVFSYLLEYALTLSILLALFVLGYFSVRKYLKNKKTDK